MFIQPGELRDGDLILMLDRYLEADPEREWLPVYNFNMLCEGKVAGRINLRIGNPDRIILYRGHIGYAVNPESRGRHFAARSVKLLLPFAADHGLNPIWITCNTDNVASRRTCEIAGAELVEIIDIPPDEETYKRGIFQKCRYRLYTV